MANALSVTYTPVDKLIPYARNARTHSDEQVSQIVASIEEWGFNNPVLIDEKHSIIAGHGRVLAAQKMGLAVVPTITLSHLSTAQKRAFMLADNKLALNAGWDIEMLGLEVKELKTEGINLGTIGFSISELNDLLADKTAGLTDADEIPDVPAIAISRLGDIWLMGNHRIICGDSTQPGVVSRVLQGAKPHLMVTDPPYGVEYDADWRNKAIMVTGEKAGEHGSRSIGKVMNDDRDDWREAWVLFPGDVAYVWHAGLHASSVQVSLEQCGFDIRSQIIWAKQQFAIGRGHYHWKHEPCWYAVRKGATGHWEGDHKQNTLWEIDKPQKSETGHSTQKPIECMKRPIENNSVAGDYIYEPFSGSGTTIIAGEMTGRKVLAVELSPNYVDVAVRRWENFTGHAAVLEETGATYEAVAASRTTPVVKE